ncbi:MAG: exodeoxyribonuclease V subunit alpha [Dokdonella sp.]
MSHYVFKRDSGELGIEPWRPIDRALYRWVRTHGGSEKLAAAAAWVSLVDGHGDAALPLTDAEGRSGMAPLSDADIAELRLQSMVATEGCEQTTPFFLDAANRFYLWRNYAHERAAAALIRARRASRLGKGVCVAESAAVDADLDILFHGERGTQVGPQREAVRSALGHKLFVLTGGPGTGKTTTVLRMLLMLQRRAKQPLTIQIAAPTGKAAQRLVQSLRQGKVSLRNHPSAPLPHDWHVLLDTVPDTDALTLHRLLGFQPWRNAFRRSARDPIAADVVVVDEASMVDLAMLHALLAAVRPDAMLILVGDADQLTSVATGSVMMDLVTAMESEGASDLVRLRHSFRAEQYLVAINEAVRAGDAVALTDAISAAGNNAMHRTIDDAQQLRQQLGRWARQLAATDGLRPTLPALSSNSSTVNETESPGAIIDAKHQAQSITAPRDLLVRAALAALGQRQLLCALRETGFGAIYINALLERLLRKAWEIPDNTEWYRGRAVIITRNDYGAGLFNGDIGLCLADSNGHLRVWFEAAEGEGASADIALRSFAPNSLPAHQAAFAITIHKSQGSEYRHAAVLLPPDADNRILSRQLLYTGISRAKAEVELWGTEAAIAAAVATPVSRVGGLGQRIAERGSDTETDI